MQAPGETPPDEKQTTPVVDDLSLPPDNDAESVQTIYDRLTPKQKAFTREYQLDRNGKQAAIRAGCSSRSAASTASYFLTLPDVVAVIERETASRAARVGMTQATVLQEMALLAASCINHYVITDDGQVRPADDAPEGVMRAIQSIRKRTTVKTTPGGDRFVTYDIDVKLWDKPNPLKLMGKQVGIFAERIEHTGKDGKPIETVSRIERVIIPSTTKAV